MLSTGEIIDGKYRIIRLIGEGGMGAVYEGENTRIHRKVAIKVLHAGLASQAETVARFEREAQAAGRIGSEHIVEVIDLGSLANGDRYLVMEFLDGESLSKRIREHGRLTPEQLAPIADQLLEALVAAHGAGIVHRDLKPDNIFLLKKNAGKLDFVKLLDFGISKFNQLSGDSGFSMTRTGAVMGTPYYMAPEQAKGSREIDHRVDLYAVGVILYECLTGQVPFNADTFNQLLFKIALEQPRPIQEIVPDIDARFVAIVNQAMAREPAHRFQSAVDLQLAIRSWLSGSLTRVPVPPGAVEAPATAPQPSQASNAASALGSRTGGSWANTNGDAKKKSATGVLVALAAAGVLLLGGGALAAYRMLGSADAPKASAGASAEPSPAPPASPTAVAQPAPAPSAEEEPPQPQAPDPAPSAAAKPPLPVPVAPVRAPEPRAQKTPSTAPRSVTPPKPSKAPAPAPTGRKFRTTL